MAMQMGSVVAQMMLRGRKGTLNILTWRIGRHSLIKIGICAVNSRPDHGTDAPDKGYHCISLCL